ncbi:hypothetical protein [Rhizobium leguminosarum]|uniref:hypothetical protein n=1 Tax=Rhizobium leguminosarum TaxID=384 RepID=UPI003F99B9DA
MSSANILLIFAAVPAPAVIIGFLYWLVRRDKQRQRDMGAAIHFALGLNLFRQRQFLRLFVDGEQTTLDREYPEWAAFRTDFLAMEPY